MTELSEWGTFCEVIGSAAGALTGLQFVTMALISEMPVAPDETEASNAFATPTVVHFGTVLFLAALLSAPWHGIAAAAALWGLAGAGGVLYTGLVIRAMRAQRGYAPVLEDWCFHAVLPLLAHGSLLVLAILARFHPRPAVFGVAGIALVLLGIGIHNAWDNTTYLVLKKRAGKAGKAG